MRQIQQNRRATEPATPGSPLDDPYASSSGGMATISHGPHLEQVPIAGLTVGEVRRRLRDRYSLPQEGLTMLDGHQVGDDTIVREGQVLTIMNTANAKGVEEAVQTGLQITIEGDEVVVALPEGSEARMPLPDLVSQLAPRWLDDCILPDGVKMVVQMPRGAIVVHQTPARPHNLRWIAKDSPADFGSEASYRNVRIALPYVTLIAVFRVGKSGKLQLSSANECFFSNAPLGSIDDPMCYPALLNVSKMSNSKKIQPLAWVCTQFLNRDFEKVIDHGERTRLALRELVRHTFEDGFNRSSEHHEGASWFGEMARSGVDERLETVETWQEATVADPMFATEVKWLPTGLTLRKIMQRIADYMHLGSPDLDVASVARMVVNRRKQK